MMRGIQSQSVYAHAISAATIEKPRRPGVHRFGDGSQTCVGCLVETVGGRRLRIGKLTLRNGPPRPSPSTEMWARLNDYGPVGRRRDSGAVEQVAGICGRVDDAAKVVMKSFNRALGRTNEFAFASALCSLAKASRYHSIPWLNLTKIPWLTRLNSVEQDLERFSLRVAPASYSVDHLDQKIASLCEDVGAIF